jgi:tetratricopeptide (TPR) repeat protein
MNRLGATFVVTAVGLKSCPHAERTQIILEGFAMKIHPPDPRLRQVLLFGTDSQDSVQEHLKGCARCRTRLEVLRKRRRGGDDAAYNAALRVDTRRLDELQTAYAKERAEAQGLVSELRRHPAERQRVLVRNHPRFQTWGVFEHLLETSRQETLINDPHVGEELARLALDLSDCLDASVYQTEAIEDLRARAWAYIGNARRVRFELREAQTAFDLALVHLRQGTREPWERAVWLDLKASLLRYQRRFDDAMRLLNRAMKLFLAVGDRHRAGRTLVSMENVLHRAGKPEKGIPLLYQAIELIDPDQEPHVLLTAKHNLIDDLAEVGRYMEAQRLSTQTRPLYRRLDPWLRYRRIWVEGKIALGLAQPERAEALLEEARMGFQQQGALYEVAITSLELAGLYAEQGRVAEMKRLAEEMVPVFSSRKIHREALAALSLWAQAVQAEEAGAELAARVASTVKQARFE